MPTQLQQHHDNGVRDDITNSIMENTMNIKNIHNNRQILCDPQSQQHHNESYSKRNFEDKNMMIVEVDHKKNNDNVKINKSNENNNRSEGTIINYKNNDNNHLNNQSSSKNLSSFSRKNVLNISSLLCEPPTATLSVYDSPSSVDEDSSMDDVSSHLCDTESLGSPSPFHKNSSTPATTPPYSPPGGMTATATAADQEKRLFNGDENIKNDAVFVNDHSQHDLQTQYYINNNNSNDHQRHQQHHHNYQDSGRYMEQGRFQEDTPWKRPRMNHDLVLPPIRSFTSASDLRSESNNNDFGNNNEISNGQFVPDHGKINSPVDHHSSQKSRNQLEQLADITESLRTSSSNSSHTDSAIRLPSLTAHSRSFENDHRNYQIQNATGNSLNSPRKSSFDVVQTRFGPYTPHTPPTISYAPQRLLSNLDQRCHSDLSGFTSTTSRNDHDYLHGHPNNSSYGYDRGDVNRHYMQQRHTYGGMHSPSSPNTYSHHGYPHSYPTPPPNHHHLQLSHHHHLGSYMDPTNSGPMVKAKRKRANASQLKVLNQVFQHTFFPSTELRIQLGKQLGMSPRTVQIWFQNKRQSWRSKSRATNSPIKDDDGDSNLEVEVNSNDNNDDVDENLVSRRSSNSNLSCSDDEETAQRSIPDSPLSNSPLSNTFPRNDYFTRSQMNNNSNENVNMTSSGKISPTQNSYFAQPPQHSPNNNGGDYYHHRRTNSNGTLSGVITSTSSSLTNQLPSPMYPSTSTNERLPTFASSFVHASSCHNTASTTSRLPMISHRSPQAQSSFGYQSTVSSGI